jgi:hypothetical protein
MDELNKVREGLFMVLGKNTTSYYMMCFAGKTPFLRVVKAIDVKNFKTPDDESYTLSPEKVSDVLDNPDKYDFYEIDSLLQKNYDDLGLKGHKQYPYLLRKYREAIANGTFNESSFVTKISSDNADISLATAGRIVNLLKNDTSKPE